MTRSRVAPKSGAALRYERQMREAKAALAAQAAQVRALREPRVEGGAEPETGIPISEQDQRVEVVAKARVKAPFRDKSGAGSAITGFEVRVPQSPPVPDHQIGCWPIVDLREGQCRFPCTPHTARPNQHLCCGQPVAWLKGKPTSWCLDHLPIIQGAPGRSAGGASVADLASGRDEPDQPPVRAGWGATGAQR